MNRLPNAPNGHVNGTIPLKKFRVQLLFARPMKDQAGNDANGATLEIGAVDFQHACLAMLVQFRPVQLTRIEIQEIDSPIVRSAFG